MSILSGSEIKKGVELGDINISPFSLEKLNPNSYNISLFNELLQILPNDGNFFDMSMPSVYHKMKIHDFGTVLRPGILYLGQTNEIAGSSKYVPMIEGRSSIGRCGIFIHVTAGFGDIGFVGRWTLEIVVTMPTVIYPDIDIGQVFFHTVSDDTIIKYDGQYQGQSEIKVSGIWREIKKPGN